MAEPITSAIDFLRLIKNEKEVLVKFEKKDGSLRLMKCTLDFTRIPQEKKPKSVDLAKILTKIQKSKILSVFDLEKQEWRTIPFNKLEFLQTPSNKKIYMLQKLK
jgi:hypothetical protein